MDFPNLNGSTVDGVNLASDVAVGDITMEGNYTLAGSSITVGGDITASNTADTFNNVVYLTHTTTVTVGTGDTLHAAGVVSDNFNLYGITLVGGGTLRFDQEAAYAGPNVVQNGTLDNENEVDTAITVDAGGTVEGNGYNDNGIIGNGGTISLGNSSSIYNVNSSGVSFGGGTILGEELSSNSGVESDGKLIVNGGTVSLTGATLTLATQNSFAPAIGDVVTLISNQTGTAIIGTFNGLAQGATTAFGGVYYQVSYIGGSSGHGRDPHRRQPSRRCLDRWQRRQRLEYPQPTGRAGVVPASGQSVDFPANSGGLADVSLGTNVTVGDITFNGNYHLAGQTITLDGDITSNSSEILVQSNLLLTHNTTMTVNSGDGLILYAISDSGNHYGITEQGAGTLSPRAEQHLHRCHRGDRRHAERKSGARFEHHAGCRRDPHRPHQLWRYRPVLPTMEEPLNSANTDPLVI